MTGDYLSKPKVRARYGVSRMTMWRWLNDPKLGFPRPVVIRGRNYFVLAELEEFERRQPRGKQSR